MSLIWAQYCISNQPFHEMLIPSSSLPGVFYTVTVPLYDDAREDWYCSCPSWTYRGTCKHLAMINPCHWNELDGPEKQSPVFRREGICPRCHEPTIKELIDE